MYVITLIFKISYACQYIEVRRLSAIESGYWLLIQGALAVIRVAVWVWVPSWDDPRAIADGSQTRGVTRQWDYDLTETRLVVLWTSLHTESAGSLRYPYPSNPLRSGQLSIPNWALPAFSPCNQDPEQMFELARKLSRDTIEWDESLQILRNAESFWDMPPDLFMAWVFAWPNSDASWVDGHEARFSCRIIKDKRYENGEQRLHFLPFWYHDKKFLNTDDDGLGNWFGARVLGVPSNRNRCVFAAVRIPDAYTYSRGPRQQKLVVGCDTPISSQTSKTPANIIEESLVEKMFEAMDLMWKSLDPILNAVRIRPTIPSSSDASTEPRTPTDPVRTSQRASPAGSAIELAPLPAADEGTQPDADIIRSQLRRRTN